MSTISLVFLQPLPPLSSVSRPPLPGTPLSCTFIKGLVRQRRPPHPGNNEVNSERRATSAGTRWMDWRRRTDRSGSGELRPRSPSPDNPSPRCPIGCSCPAASRSPPRRPHSFAESAHPTPFSVELADQVKMMARSKIGVHCSQDGSPSIRRIDAAPVRAGLPGHPVALLS
ncbi:hypothetical protein B0H16DRAFT_50611 [Mycena metata]|uniref:Uncharacterized protein n=1 Tax=Mycena metata TaxID=1033252 RepID=A0AAD7IG92_9AGAR|nr:hypothetical protein B0H16DRAFT_50611 [Mycena metata]